METTSLSRVITQRVNSCDAAIAQHPGRLEALVRLQVEAGLLVLQVTVNESERLVAQVRGRQLIVEDTNRSSAVAAAHQLLHDAEILYDAERAGL